MNKTVSDLWKLYLSTCPTEKNDNEKKIVKILDENENELLKTLNDNQKMLLKNIENCFDEIIEIESQAAFNKGLHFAGNLLLEIISGNPYKQ